MKKIIFILFCSLMACAITLTNGDKSLFPSVNLMSQSQSSFENGFTASGWSETGGGALAITATAANVAEGGFAMSFDSSAQNDYAISPSITLPNVLKNRNAILNIMVKGGDINNQLQVINNASTILASAQLGTQTDYTLYSLIVPCGISTSVQVKILTTVNANPVIVYLDSVYIGDSERILSGRVESYGAVDILPNAAHSFSTSSGTYTKVTDADIISTDKTHIGKAIITANAGDFGLGFANVPSGAYKITVLKTHSLSASGLAYANGLSGISDDNCSTVKYSILSGTYTTNSIIHLNTETFYIYYATDQGAKEFVLCVRRVDQGTQAIDNISYNFTMIVEKYPLN